MGWQKYRYAWYPLDRQYQVGWPWGSRVPKYLESGLVRLGGRDDGYRAKGGTWGAAANGKRKDKRQNTKLFQQSHKNSKQVNSGIEKSKSGGACVS